MLSLAMTSGRDIRWAGGPPGAALADRVERLWSAQAGDAGASHRVLPDGCVDLVLGEDGEALVVGPLSRARVVALGAGSATAGLRFRPGAASAVLGVAASELLDATLPLADVSPALHRRLSRELTSAAPASGVPHRPTRATAAGPATPSGPTRAAAAAPATPSGPTRATAAAAAPATPSAPAASGRPAHAGPAASPLATALAGAVAAHGWAARRDREIDAVVALLWHDGAASVRDVARAVGLSERQLRRRCHERCGHGPAELGRVLRLRRLLQLAREQPGASLAALALAGGYHDQQHMTRELRRLTGTTPARLLRRDGRSVQDRRAAAA